MSESRKTTCRYLKSFGHQCTAEAVDPRGDILLCIRHLADAQQLIAAAVSSSVSPAERAARRSPA